ncbi:hypothetical protein BC834DRAFT_690259 [Gloeopeniophorella convolvens]|nr:hypothetical protein BC834DRAFT_690259 [Gloeopeniophorella convolvens]
MPTLYPILFHNPSRPAQWPRILHIRGRPAPIWKAPPVLTRGQDTIRRSHRRRITPHLHRTQRQEEGCARDMIADARAPISTRIPTGEVVYLHFAS